MSILNQKSQTSNEKLLEEILKRETAVELKKEKLEEERKNLEAEKDRLLQALEKVGEMTPDEARKKILKLWEEKLSKQIAQQIRAAEEKAQEQIDQKVKELLVEAMRHAATDYTAEYTISTITVDNEEMKGRIIGKEGRNIRAFEQATGVDVDLDEEGIIRLSSFDPVRREIARVALLLLIKDGRIQPVRIEEVVAEVKKDIERIMFEEGKKLAHSLEVYNLPTELIALLGRFKYRFSYGQSMILHTIEETKLGVKLANELGLDVNIVRLGCLLHDIGKVVTDKQGNHVDLGVEVLKKYNIPKEVVGCVASHHEDIPFPSLEAVIVNVADSISGARPGARMEDYGEYVKRLEGLEAIVKEFAGIKEVYAVQAGREIRVMVDPEELNDDQMTMTAQQIREKVAEKYPDFPGSIKITLVREKRVTAIVD